MLYDSKVSSLASELFQAVKVSMNSEATLSLDRDGVLSFLTAATVNLLQEEPKSGVHQAFLPVADWPTLVKRRQVLVDRINGQARKALRGFSPLKQAWEMEFRQSKDV